MNWVTGAEDLRRKASLDLRKRRGSTSTQATQTRRRGSAADISTAISWIAFHPADADLRLRRENYGDADLEAWAERMRSQGWSEAYVFFKHEDDGTAPQFALRLCR